MIMHSRLVNQLEKEIPEPQYGFRPKKSTQIACFALKEIIRQRINAYKKTPLPFVDFQKAFLSVNRKLLCGTMRKKNINPRLMKLIANIYRLTKVPVKYKDGFLKEAYSTSCDLPEGCCLSPLFFVLFDQISTQ